MKMKKCSNFFVFCRNLSLWGAPSARCRISSDGFLHYYSGNSGKDFVTLHIYVGIQLVSTHFVPADGVSVLGNDKIILYD